ncbi:putative methyltransferase-domain-containing protein [Lanmaoa asiatica]|nr:putative methyltransferase-domain-containing protein [Lanmaoa asiatica]
MFYYISFLRPPPLQASTTPTEPILITPQICNDLRTEYLDGSIDIYYAWSLHSPHATSPMITKLTKLTSWRMSTAYKEIPVPRPPCLDGQNRWRDSEGPSWRLILTCGSTQNDQVTVLGETDMTGITPFAVMSMPGTKQERIVRSYSLRVPLQDHPIVFGIMEQTSFDLDKKIWDSGIGLSSWLVQLFSGKGVGTDARHILELGAGTGVVAITLAVLRSTLDLSDQPSSIVTTDLCACPPPTQPTFQFHSFAPTASAIPIPTGQRHLQSSPDEQVMADVTYNTASFPALIGTLSRLIQFSKHKRNGHSPRVLMGYKERHPDERSLWDRARGIDLHFQQIAHINGAGGNPVEIWLG